MIHSQKESINNVIDCGFANFMVDFIDIQHLAKYLDQIVINDSFGISELIIYKEIFHDINNNSRTDEALTSDLYNSDIDESISNVYLQHHQTFNLEYRSVVEFRIDGDQLTYLIIAVDYWNYVLFENKTDSVKRFSAIWFFRLDT